MIPVRLTYDHLFRHLLRRETIHTFGLALVSFVVLCGLTWSTFVNAQNQVIVESPQTDRTQEPARFQRAERSITGRYIVVFKESADLEASPRFTDNRPVSEAVAAQEVQRQQRINKMANDLSFQYAATREQTYLHTLKGFSAWMSEAQALALSRDPRVQYVAEDGLVRTSNIQRDAPWGLDRVDAHSRSLNEKYSWNASGRGVNVYVLDTGINYAHQDFEGRAVPGFDAYMGNGQDCNGHGTHVASTIAGRYAGVAKNARVINVRVLKCNGEGSFSDVIAGIDWVTANAAFPAVANMSLGAKVPEFIQVLDDAVRKSIARGIIYVIAAGNDGEDAKLSSPARVREAITVGATDRTDNETWFSNHGPLVDLYAPGDAIEGATIGDNSSFIRLSGTSMAAPHVAGAAAIYLQQVPTLSPAGVQTKIKQNATSGVVQGRGPGSPNLLLFTRLESDASIVTATFPKTLRKGQTATVTVTVKNTGATAWFGTEYFRLGSATPRDNKTWGLNRIELPPGRIAPNSTVKFSFLLTAPQKTGKYNCDWRMVQDTIEWFGDTLERTIEVQ
jgi:aqualysin 1